MLLQSGIIELLHSLVGTISRVVDCSGNVLYVCVYLLFIGCCRLGTGANEIDKRLDVLNQKGGLVFKVVLGNR